MEKYTVSKATAGDDEESPSGSDKCYICLNPFEEQTVASLESCQHVFCLDCILQWSQTSNTCPVDRISFAFIHQRRRPGGDIQKRIRVETRKRDADEEEEAERGSVVICEECGRSDRRHQLLVCMQCDSGYHMVCLRPPLNRFPEGDWICHECVVVPQQTDIFTVEGEISEGELSDLLAEADEVSSSSSRLRPSTMSGRGASTDRRRSPRIQTRTSRDPDPGPQTSWHVPKYLLRASKPAVAADQVATSENSATGSATVKLKTRKRKSGTAPSQ